MQHDPFCKAYYPDLTKAETCMWCMVIRRVREDEQNKIDLDVAYWQGYNNAMVEMSSNEDNKAMSSNDYNDGWYTNGVTYMTKEHVVNQWNELFDANPWLEGFAADENCGIIDCCQQTEPENWLVFDKVTTLLWLSGLENEKVLHKDLIQKFGGTE